jgi:ABC-type lipoprotein export system ATPase subunit
VVTHEPDVAAFAGRVVTMKDGKVKSDRRQEPLDARDALARAVALHEEEMAEEERQADQR